MNTPALSCRTASLAAMLLLPFPVRAAGPAPAEDAAATGLVPQVVVTATRVERTGFALPLSIDLIPRDAIRDGQAQVNLSESLMRVPGIVAQHRQNYAQDLQISARGFGARSTFGVRGLRLYADGIPATMPDGQGQVSHFDLGSAERIEVLRGPFSALYGNSSGGVIALFTENGKPGLALDGSAAAGSDGTRRYAVKASGEQGTINYVLSASRFSTDGYREHGAATRLTENAKLRWRPDGDSSLTLVGNAVRMHDVQDPLGLTAAQFDANPRGADPAAINFNTRKSVDQHQAGVIYEHRVDQANSLHATIYAGSRATVQYQAIPVAAQAAPTSAGGVIDLDRDYWGADLRWTRRGRLAGQPLEWTAGIAYDNLDEARRGHENFLGPNLGVRGRLRRDESNRVFNLDQYVQAQWEAGERWLLLAGIRNSSIRVRSNDHYIGPGNGDDSGSVRYHALNPVLGASFRPSESVNVYASYGKGFETPTFNELSYRSTSGAGTGLNFGLAPSRSDSYEMGIKAQAGKRLRASAALFHTDTRDEITVLANAGGRAVYQNAARTRRDGIELSMDGAWPNGLSSHVAFTWIRAVYADPFCSGPCSAATRVGAGTRIPGIPVQNLYSELAWRHAATGFTAALEARYSGKVFVDDVNSSAARTYVVMNLRAGFEQKLGRWTLAQFARIDNIADRQYAGSVIVNESNRRFFEPAPGRQFLAGLTATYAW